MTKKAFTLIELLVVISIIALLLAILMPALGKVKEKAAIVVCGNNQHQLIIGLGLYMNESLSGKLPPSSSWAGGGNFHRPTELNWYGNAVGTLNPGISNYHYVAKYLGGYIPDPGVFSCKMTPLNNDTPWPPPGSRYGEPVGTYGEFYRTGTYAPVHCTYTLLWSYQGYNFAVSPYVDKNLADFEGPTKISSKNKLVVQDAFFYLPQGQANLAWDTPENAWYSPHRFQGSSKALPYYVQSGQETDIIREATLNAGYLDGRVERFKSEDGIDVKNWTARARLAPSFR